MGELMSGLISSTVMRLCWLHWVLKSKGKTGRIRQKTHHSVCVQLLAKAFPVLHRPSLAMYVEMDDVHDAGCVQVQLQALFCPKRLPCIFSLCILERRKDKSEKESDSLLGLRLINVRTNVIIGGN